MQLIQIPEDLEIHHGPSPLCALVQTSIIPPLDICNDFLTHLCSGHASLRAPIME